MASVDQPNGISSPNEEPASADTLTLKTIKALTREMFGQANVISAPRVLILLTGDHVSAILLNQIIYWSERSENPDGWFYKTAEDWYEEAVITYSQIERALDRKLRNLGVETCVRKVGTTPKTHYRINHDIFGPLFLSFLENQKTRNSGNLKVRKGNFSNSGNLKVLDIQESRKSIKETENTTENTPTDTEAPAAPSPVVCVGSKFSLVECRRYAEHLKASGKGITNPGGYATSIFRSGKVDAEMESFLKGERPGDLSACPDCQGRGVRYVDPANYEKGTVRCKHPRLARLARRE